MDKLLKSRRFGGSKITVGVLGLWMVLWNAFRGGIDEQHLGAILLPTEVLVKPRSRAGVKSAVIGKKGVRSLCPQ
jgi:hypothetical protein